MKKIKIISILLLAAIFSAPALSAPSLDSLLKQVKQAKAEEARMNKQREAEFLKDKKRQAQLLASARAKLAAEKARGEQLKLKFDDMNKNLPKRKRRWSGARATWVNCLV